MGKAKPHTNRHYWTIQEHNYLRKHAGKFSAPQIAATLDIPVHKVRDYARRKNIPLQRHGEAIDTALLNGLLVDMLTVLKDAGFTSEQIRRAFNLKAARKTIDSAVLEGVWGME